MTAAWPSDVNQIAQTSTYSEAADLNVASFKPEVGPPKLRRRMSISTDTLGFQLWVTSAEYASFLTFYRTTLKDGTLPFTFTHPRTKAVTSFVFAGDSAPKIEAMGADLFALSMTIRTLPT